MKKKQLKGHYFNASVTYGKIVAEMHDLAMGSL